MKKLLFSLAFLMAVPAIATESKIIFQRLSESRKSITFHELTETEKRTIVAQVRLILKDVFVHRDLKIKNWGPEADPLPALEKLEAKIPTLSTPDFHGEMLKVFQRVHDFHTMYYLPKPYSCYRVMLPPAFRSVKDEYGNDVIGIDLLATNSEFWKVVPPDVKFNIGDTLIKYDGMTPEEFVSRNGPLSNAANEAAIYRDGVFRLGFRSMKYGLLPEKDEVVLTLRDQNGDDRTVTVPWITKVDEACLNPGTSESGGHGLKGMNETRREFHQLYKRKKLNLKGPGELQDTKEPVLKYKTIRNEFGFYGYLRLNSFDPEKLSKEATVLEIKRVLEGPLAMTEGLIIDLRGNPGGRIYIGEAMVQLLTPKNPAPLNFHLRNTPPVRHHWSSIYPDTTFNAELVRAQEEGREITSGVPMYPSPIINGLGQSYMKPVAVFIDSACYSTCDMFSASMQDLGVGIIVGEDRNTGAGGANNWYHSDIMADFGDAPSEHFRKLPDNIDISFSYRQSTRTGPHAGEVIEDVGVKADLLIEPKIDDLGDDELQLRSLSRKLAEESLKYQSWVKFEAKEFVEVKQGERPSLQLKWEEMDSIDLRIDGMPKGTIEIEPSQTEGRDVIIPEFLSTLRPGSQVIELIGRRDTKRVWRKMINIRIVPSESIIVSKEKPLIMDLTSGVSPFVIYNLSAPESGWRTTSSELALAKVPYKPNLDTTASIFAKIVDAKTLTFKAKISTEKDYDFFSVSVFSEGTEKRLLNLSGELLSSDYQVDLTEYQGKAVEIRFRFTSDGGLQENGVSIDELKIE